MDGAYPWVWGKFMLGRLCCGEGSSRCAPGETIAVKKARQEGNQKSLADSHTLAPQRGRVGRGMAWQVLGRIALIIAITEVGIMLVLGRLAGGELMLLPMVADALGLVLIACPLVYWLVVRPFVLDRELLLAEARHLAHHDELTRLYNRRMFHEHLRQALASIRRHDRVGILVYIDLDGFKPINDEFGHKAGDCILVELARRFKATLREEDPVARLGGDEFGVLVTPTDVGLDAARSEACRLAERLQEEIARPLNLDGRLLQVGSSLGIHMLEADTENTDVAMRLADMAMYRAKEGNLGKVVFSDQWTEPDYHIKDIGVREIDLEHRDIDETLAKLNLREEALRWSDLEELVQQVVSHFDSEVTISRRLGLNLSQAHLQEHQRLAVTLKDMLENGGDQYLHQHDLNRVAELLQQHVYDYDRELVLLEADLVETDTSMPSSAEAATSMARL